MNTRCPPKRVPSSRPLFFTLQTHHAATQELQCRRTTHLSGSLQAKPAGARPDYRGRWCSVSRGHPDRPNPPSPRATLGQLCAAPWKLPSSIGKGIAWIRTRDLQAIEHILHSRGAPLLDVPLGSPVTASFLPSSHTGQCYAALLIWLTGAPLLPSQPLNSVAPSK
ncbi:UNVERIFIED_CONTAM: hypothetical protein FKN15_065463 [Acipenser sinensis]